MFSQPQSHGRLSKDHNIIKKEHEQLDSILGGWRKIDVLLEGKDFDGWYELVQEHPVTIVYNRDTMELSIKYRMQRLNKHGNFQFA